MSLTPVRVQILRYLAELRFMSLPQIARLCCPSQRRDLSEKSARRHMRALFDAGLADVLPVSRAALAPPGTANDASLLYGSAPNVYAPTTQAVKLLFQAGLVGDEALKRPAPAYGPRNSLFLAHELAVRDVRVWIESCSRHHSLAHEEGGYQMLAWKDGAEAIIPLARGQVGEEVRPDAWFVYRICIEPSRVLVGLVEVDRDTERGDRKWREKLESYAALFASGKLAAVTGYVNARILIFCPNERRCDRLAELIGEYGGKAASRFWLAESSTLEKMGLSEARWRNPPNVLLRPLIAVNAREEGTQHGSGL